MELKLFKNFTAYHNIAGHAVSLPAHLYKLSDYASRDPDGSEWGTVGFAPLTDGDDPEFFMDLQGAGTLMLVQFNERILPAAVRDEKVAARVAEIQERDGHKVSKKLYAQIRDDISTELLPQAFIKRSYVPVMLVGAHTVFVFTSSSKKADDAILRLFRAIGNDTIFQPALLVNLVEKVPTGVLESLAKLNSSDSDSDYHNYFEVTDSIVLKGANKQTIRIKDKDVGGEEVQGLLAGDKYAVTQLGLAMYDPKESDPIATFTLNEKLTFTRLVTAGTASVKAASAEERADSFMNGAWLIARTCKQIHDLTVEIMGGFKPAEDAADTTETEDDEDEL